MQSRITLKKLVLFLGDTFLLYLSLVLTVFFGFLGNFNFEILVLHVAPFSIIYFFWLLTFYIFGLYDLHLSKSRIYFYSRSFGAMLVNLILGMLFFYAITLFGISPKTNLILNSLIFGSLFLIWRRLFYSLFSIHFLNQTAVIGRDHETAELKHQLEARPYLGYKLVSFDVNQDFLPQIQRQNINTIIFTDEFEANPNLLKALYISRVNFLDFATAYELIYEKIPISSVSHSWFLENMKEGGRALYDNIKMFLDIIFASSILVFSLPIWFVVAILIILGDRGPVIYSQTRIGKEKKHFTLYKFRSMKVNAEEGGAVWAKKHDHRTTMVGKFLRRTHFDELPQMINVIKGDISLVGPRPERPEFVRKLEEEIPHYNLRHIIKPGFTGWAQLKFRYGRSIKDSQEKLEYDLYYLKNRGFLLDLGILLKTVQLLFKHE
jgi:exopolysaccharide biosynthesis polyprenyl glycosylphosphotransferase